MQLCDFNKHRLSSFTFNIKKYECVVNYILLSKKYFIEIFLLAFFLITESTKLRKYEWSFQSPRKMVASCFLISEKSYANSCLCQLYIILWNSSINWETLSASSILPLFFTSYKFHLQNKLIS